MDTKAHPRETVVTLKPKHARNRTKLPEKGTARVLARSRSLHSKIMARSYWNITRKVLKVNVNLSFHT